MLFIVLEVLPFDMIFKPKNSKVVNVAVEVIQYSVFNWIQRMLRVQIMASVRIEASSGSLG